MKNTIKGNPMKYSYSRKSLYNNVLITSTMLISIAACSSSDNGPVLDQSVPLDPLSVITLDNHGVQGSSPSVSADGRYIAFQSYESNLVENDTNRKQDIYRYDTYTKTFIRVSVKDDESEVYNGYSSNPSISADGRYVAFLSDADDFSPEDTDILSDVYVRDIENGTTTLASVSTNGDKSDGYCLNPKISPDGSFVVFTCRSSAQILHSDDLNQVGDVFIRMLKEGKTELVSYRSGVVADGESWVSSISGNGRIIAFSSVATNLVDGDSNGASDAFIYDIQTGQIELVSRNSEGDPALGDSLAGDLSYDGNIVGIYSYATNLVVPNTNGVDMQLYAINRTNQEITTISFDDAGALLDGYDLNFSISSSGQFAVFQNHPNNGVPQIYLRDIQNEMTSIVDINEMGELASQSGFEPMISADGRYIVFVSDAENLVGWDLVQYDENMYKAPNILY